MEWLPGGFCMVGCGAAKAISPCKDYVIHGIVAAARQKIRITRLINRSTGKL